MLNPSTVSACLVTRGDVDLTTILHSLPFDDVIVWNNAERENLQCYGRFAAIAEARNEWIYTQDDDLLVPIAGLLRAWNGDTGILANKPEGEEWRFLGCGAIFHRSLADCFTRYLERWPDRDDFYRVADVVFAYQHPYRSVWLGYLDFPWQTADNRMYKQPNHYLVRERARDRAKELNGH